MIVAQREVGAGLVARIARQMQAARVVIDMRDPQALARRIAVGETAGEKFAGGGEAVEFQRKFGTLIPHACSLCETGEPPTSNRIRIG